MSDAKNKDQLHLRPTPSRTPTHPHAHGTDKIIHSSIRLTFTGTQIIISASGQRAAGRRGKIQCTLLASGGARRGGGWPAGGGGEGKMKSNSNKADGSGREAASCPATRGRTGPTAQAKKRREVRGCAAGRDGGGYRERVRGGWTVDKTKTNQASRRVKNGGVCGGRRRGRRGRASVRS